MKKGFRCLLAILIIALVLPLGFAGNKSYAEVSQFGKGLDINSKCDYDSSLVKAVEPEKVSDSIPDEYNLTDEIYIQVENQTPTNICWSFATLTMLETYIAKNYNEYYQFSAIHQATAKFVEDNSNNGTANFINQSIAGGNIYNFLSYISHDVGPVLEEQMPFSSFYNASSDTVTQYYNTNRNNFDKIVSVNSVLHFGSDDDSIDQIKQHLMSNGACVSNIYSSGGFYKTGDNYYLSKNSSSQTADHMITIIGWDDNFTVSGYAQAGSWIVQNSWGNSYTYFYVSYYDNNIKNNIYGIGDATLELSSNSSINNLSNLPDCSISSWYYSSEKQTNLYLSIVSNVYSYIGNKISSIKIPFTTNSSTENNYSFYLYFADSLSVSKISKPANSLQIKSFSKEGMFNYTKLSTPLEITNKYAVLIVYITDFYGTISYSSSQTASDTLVSNTFISSTGRANSFEAVGLSGCETLVTPVVYGLESTATVKEFVNNIPEKIDEKYSKNNSLFVGNVVQIPVETTHSISLNDITIYTRKYTSSLVKTDYTDKFTINIDSDNNIEIAQNQSLEIQNYFCSIKIGNQVFVKQFSTTDTILTYPISYHLEEGETTINSPSFSPASSSIKLYSASKLGYDFISWCLDSGLTNPIIGTSGADNNGDYVIYEIPSDSHSLDFYPKFELSAPTISSQPSGFKKTYNKSASTLSISANHSLCTINYQWFYRSSEQAEWRAKVEANTSDLSIINVAESGQYKCVISVTDNKTTKSVDSKTVDVVIEKAHYQNLKWNYSYPFNFDAQPKTVAIINNYTDDLTIAYSNNSKTNAGSYTAVADIVNKNKNFYDPEIATSLDWKISPANLTITIKCFELETQDSFNSFTTNLCSCDIKGTIYDNYKPNLVYTINTTSNPNLKTITASYTTSNNYLVTLIDGEIRLIRHSLTVSTETYQVTIERDKGYLVNASLDVSTLKENDLDANHQKFLADNKLVVYDIYSLLVTGDDNQEAMKVQLTLNPNLKDKNVQVYFVGEDGLTLIESVSNDGEFISFTTDKLGTFVIVESADEMELKHLIIGGIIILGAGLLVCIFIGLIKKRRNDRYVTNRSINTPH